MKIHSQAKRETKIELKCYELINATGNVKNERKGEQGQINNTLLVDVTTNLLDNTLLVSSNVIYHNGVPNLLRYKDLCKHV